MSQVKRTNGEMSPPAPCPGCGGTRHNEQPYNYLDGQRWWYCLRCCLTFSTPTGGGQGMMDHADTVNEVLADSDALCEGCGADPRVAQIDDVRTLWCIDIVLTEDEHYAEVLCPTCLSGTTQPTGGGQR
jgi:hypothetical protein